MTNLSISFVLPAYNEKDNIEDTVRAIKAIAKEITGDFEIIISDDASTDGSPKLIDRIEQKDLAIKAIHMKKNSKFGGAFIKALEKAEKDVIVYTDSDLPVTREDIMRALPLIEEADIVTAFNKSPKGENFKRIIMSRFYNLMIQLLFSTGIKDINSGFKIYRRSAIAGMKLQSRSPFVDVEIFLNAKLKKYKIVQFPVEFIMRRKGKSYMSKLNIILATLYDMLKAKLSHI